MQVFFKGTKLAANISFNNKMCVMKLLNTEKFYYSMNNDSNQHTRFFFSSL